MGYQRRLLIHRCPMPAFYIGGFFPVRIFKGTQKIQTDFFTPNFHFCTLAHRFTRHVTVHSLYGNGRDIGLNHGFSLVDL